MPHKHKGSPVSLAVSSPQQPGAGEKPVAKRKQSERAGVRTWSDLVSNSVSTLVH